MTETTFPTETKPPRGGRGNLLIGLLLVIAVGGLFAFVTRPAKTPAGWSEDFEAARTLAVREGLPMFIDFNATWCGPCQMMARDVLPQERVADALRGFVAVRVDVDKDRQTAAAFRIEALPAFVVLNTAGREVYRFEGYRSVDDFLAEIAEARGRLGRK